MGQEAIPISSNEMRKIHRGGEGSSSQSAAGRKVNVSQSRREQPVREPGKPGKAPKEPKEKAKHPILRFIGRTIATLLCLGDAVVCVFEGGAHGGAQRGIVGD
jgi:penicillin-binding protein 1A